VLPPVKENKKLRAQIESEIKTKGLDFVFKKLVALDRKAAHVVDRRNPRRIIRALEVAILTGEPFTAQRKIEKPSFDFLQIGLSLPKDVLRQRIERRVDQMIKRGLVREVKNLVKKYGENQIAFDAIGYREIIDFLNGKTGLNEAIEKIKKNTWHYARRQLAWFKRDKKVNWLDNIKTIESTAKKWLSP
jgi:tRNA dimethylallyltransferase